MKIRDAKKEDFDVILDLQLQLEDAEVVFDENLKKHFYDTEEGRKKLMKRITRKDNVFLVMENDDSKVIAFIDGSIPDDEWWYKEKVAYIDHLVVDKDYRKKGIATQLVNKFEELARKEGAIDIRLLAFPKNVPAVTFYNKNMFDSYSVYYNKRLK